MSWNEPERCTVAATKRESDTADPPKRIPAQGGDEHDVFSRRARRIHCWTQRAGACKGAKQSYNRRFRHLVKRILQGQEP